MNCTPLARCLAAVTLLLCSSAATRVVAAEPLAPYPPAADGQLRFVIHLDARADESLHQVELLVGREMEVDCNRRAFGGAIESGTVAGWGYSYYRVSDIREAATTMMACPENSSRMAFVSLGGTPYRVRYNSRLPLVVYVPDGFEVRYRLWSADVREQRASIE